MNSNSDSGFVSVSGVEIRWTRHSHSLRSNIRNPQKMLDDVQFQAFIISSFDELLFALPVKTAHLVHEVKEYCKAVAQMCGYRFVLLCSHGLDVQADELTLPAKSAFLEHTHLVEGAAKIC